tara:strand:+ start:519 stop:911 length:393 start_codon:yes stop_codon:yes gene_type:complete
MIPNIINKKFTWPKIASAGTVVRKATGRIRVKNNLRLIGYAEIGNLPADKTARRTSVAFHVLTNHILVVATKNHKEYRIIIPTLNIIKNKIILIRFIGCSDLTEAHTTIRKPRIISGNPEGEIVLVEIQN